MTRYKATRRVLLRAIWYEPGAVLPPLSTDELEWFKENGRGYIAPVTEVEAQRATASAAKAVLMPRPRVGGCGACGR